MIVWHLGHMTNEMPHDKRPTISSRLAVDKRHPLDAKRSAAKSLKNIDILFFIYRLSCKVCVYVKFQIMEPKRRAYRAREKTCQSLWRLP